MRLSMQCDSGGARARSEERALGLAPFSQKLRHAGKKPSRAEHFAQGLRDAGLAESGPTLGRQKIFCFSLAFAAKTDTAAAPPGSPALKQLPRWRLPAQMTGDHGGSSKDALLGVVLYLFGACAIVTVTLAIGMLPAPPLVHHLYAVSQIADVLVVQAG